MLLQILNSPHAFGPLEIIFLTITCVVIGAIVCFVLLRAHLAAKADVGAPAPVSGAVGYTEGPEPASKFKLRKWAPALIFFGSLAAFIALAFLLKHVPALTGAPAALPPASAGVLPDVDGATQDVAQATGGYVQLGGLTSKLLIIILLYSLGSFLPWLLQQLTHPGPTKWKKEHYTDEFKELPSYQKFEVDGRLALSAAIRWAAVVVGACLIQ